MPHSNDQITSADFAPTPIPRRKMRLGVAVASVYYAALLLVSVAVLLVGLFGPDKHEGLVTAGAVGVLLALAIAPLLMQLDKLNSWCINPTISRNIDQLAVAVRVLADHSNLSPDARRVLNRQAERELLCRAIEEDINKQEWDAATVLSTELADRFGYRVEAEAFRSRIDRARAGIQERKLADAIAQLDGLIVQRRWDPGFREAASIARLFPDSPRVEGLRHRVEQARTVYRADLERRFLEAAQGGRIDDAMTLLKELDSYLTEADAEPYREVARGVISKARENLGAQFKIAVQDRHWSTAAAIGRRIINEFPNTRMAQEVRQMLDGILTKANAAANGAAVTA
ncbi:MAG: hypothetical protein H7Y88_07135 [Phycisphaerales bacterium]|nr:hypothetical protein [Phycisphaerales bacterium]